MSSDLEAMEAMEASNAGGVGAKHGFLYQDYAAAHYLIGMLLDKRLKAVRCEVTDDIDLIYDDYIEYVQVKSTDGEKKWSLTEFYETSPVKTVTVNGKKVKEHPKDSILHKSLACDNNKAKTAKFRILTKREVSKKLEYLRIDRNSRDHKDGRDQLVKSLFSKLKKFVSPNANGTDYWVDNAYWQVSHSINELELESERMILRAAASNGMYIDPVRGPERILNDILCTLTKKSAISRTINTASDKTYCREDFITWFEEELNDLENKGISHRKIYSKKAEDLKTVLVKFIDLEDVIFDDRDGMGLHQGYDKNNYRFDYIAKTLKSWIPELLLLPNELADSSGTNFIKQCDLLAERLSSHSDHFESLIGRLLLHATIRFYSKSQPIPATLFIESNQSFKEFDNIHIVKCDDRGDELWMGFSKLTSSSDISETITAIAEELDELISNDFTLQKEKILDIKQDSYLIKHDIDEILKASSSLDDHKDRFRFVIFIGYESDHLSIKCSKTNMSKKYKDDVEIEVKEHFDLAIQKIIEKDEYFEDIKITLYIYPCPCISTLIKTIEQELMEK